MNAAGLFGGLVLARALVAQAPTPAVERLKRLDSLLVVRLDELRASGRQEESRGVVLNVDGLSILSDSSVAEVVRAGARGGWTDVRARGKGWATRVAANVRVHATLESRFGRRDKSVSLAATSLADAALTAVSIAPAPDSAGVHQATRDLFSHLLHNSLDTTIRARLLPEQGSNLHVLDVSALDGDLSLFAPVDGSSWRWSSIHLLARHYPARSSRACLAGSLPDCATSLGIGVPPRAPVATWFDPVDYPWVFALASYRVDTLSRFLRNTCLGGDAQACGEFVARTPPGEMRAPLHSRIATETLLMLALEAGGPDAVDRLLGATGSFAERLGVAAGVPFETLLGTWQSRVSAAPLTRERLDPRVFASALLACGLLIAWPRRGS